MPIFTNGSYENLVYGGGGVSPLKASLERYLDMAARDDSRLRIEIRAKPQDASSSHQEHQWEVDTTEVTVGGLLRNFCDKLQESPGESFAGELRFNFSQAGRSGRRYGSFTRVVIPSASRREGNRFADALPGTHSSEAIREALLTARPTRNGMLLNFGSFETLCSNLL